MPVLTDKNYTQVGTGVRDDYLLVVYLVPQKECRFVGIPYVFTLALLLVSLVTSVALFER